MMAYQKGFRKGQMPEMSLKKREKDWLLRTMLREDNQRVYHDRFAVQRGARACKTPEAVRPPAHWFLYAV
jgi:hypothetical protein